MGFEAVEEHLEAAVGQVFPGAVLLVRDDDKVFYLRAFGKRTLDPEAEAMQEGTIFDLSSLTMALATSVAVMLLKNDGKIFLDDRVCRFFPGFAVHGKGNVTLRQLLNHSSGLPGWRPYYKKLLQVERREGKLNFVGSPAAREYVYQEIQRERPEAAAGQRAIYSDLGFMLLGAAVEAISGMSLNRFCDTRVFRPLGLRATGFVDLAPLRAGRVEPITEMIAPTEQCPWRKRLLCGEVHDDNASAMGGVAGHAGLFASARDIDTLLLRLRRCYEGDGDFIPRDIISEFWTVDRNVPGSTWALGWDSPAPVNSAAGRLFSPHTVGHLGFTGTSIWLDLERKRHVILLTNRVHPTRDNDAIREFRPAIHDLINRALGT